MGHPAVAKVLGPARKKGQTPPLARERTRVAGQSAEHRLDSSLNGNRPQYALRAWPEIAARWRAAEHRALLLDFDGTLVELRPHPDDVRISPRARRILERLAAQPNLLVALVSGRTLRDLRARVGVPGIRYLGLHGWEEQGKPARAKGHPALLRRAKQIVRARLKGLPGIWIENKGSVFAVHYRRARPAVAKKAEKILLETIAPWHYALYLMGGEKVWEVLPREIEGKGAAATRLLGSQPQPICAVCVGDDCTDEHTFSALPHQITVRVGKKNGTHARYYLRNPREVLECLERMEAALA